MNIGGDERGADTRWAITDVSGMLHSEGKEATMDEAWDAVDDVVVIPCFDCGDEVVVNAVLEAEAVLCDMCSLTWEHLAVEQYRTTNY